MKRRLPPAVQALLARLLDDPRLADYRAELAGNNSHRKTLRHRFRGGVTVRVRCGSCRSHDLAELYGTNSTVLAAIWGPTGATAGLLGVGRPGSLRYGPPQHWHCRCGAAYPISGAALAVAFLAAAGEAKPDRVVWLPLAG